MLSGELLSLSNPFTKLSSVSSIIASSILRRHLFSQQRILHESVYGARKSHVFA